jgi:phage gpG-like protein
MTAEEFKKRLKFLEKEFKELYTRYAPAIAGNTAVSLFKKNFREGGFFGAGWQEVQRRTEGTATYKYLEKVHPKDTQRIILTGRSGDLGRSIEYKITSSGVVILTDPGTFKSRQPYGRVHNEGLRAGRGAGFTMPKRQFIGDHPTVRKAIVEKLEKKLRELR